MLFIAPLLMAGLFVADVYPDPAMLIQHAIARDEAQNKRNEKYTWREDEVRPDEKMKTYESIMLEGENYRKLLLMDGKPLDAKTAHRVDEALEKARQERRKRSIGFHKTISDASLEQMGRLFENKVTGQESVNGRMAWRVESGAKPGLKGASASEEEILSTRRITWFDVEDGAVARKRTTYVRNAHQVQAGNEIEVESQKIGDSWVLASIDFHPNIKFMPGLRITNGVRTRYYDFRKFTVESTFTPN